MGCVPGKNKTNNDSSESSDFEPLTEESTPTKDVRLIILGKLLKYNVKTSSRLSVVFEEISHLEVSYHEDPKIQDLN